MSVAIRRWIFSALGVLALCLLMTGLDARAEAPPLALALSDGQVRLLEQELRDDLHALDAFARQRHRLYITGLSRIEPHRGAGGDVEPHAARLFAVELQRRIGFEEMIMRADLDRPISAIGNRERHGLAAGIEFDLAVLDEEFAGDHFASSVIPGRGEASNPESRK